MMVSNVWAEIDSCNRKLVETLLRRDMEGLADMYVADAALLPPDAPVLRGRQEICAYWQGFLAHRPSEGRMEVLNLERLGDALQAIGRARWITQPPGSPEPVLVYVKFVAIYKWEEGEWKITLNIFNKTPPF